MRSKLPIIIIAAGVLGFAASSAAQGVKKLPPSPRAAADPSLQQNQAPLPGNSAAGGEAAAPKPKPPTGDPVTPGGSSTATSKVHQ